MGQDYDSYERYPAECGTLLDMAFLDRNKMWSDLGKKLGCKFMRMREGDAEEPPFVHIVHQYDVSYRLQYRVRSRDHEACLDQQDTSSEDTDSGSEPSDEGNGEEQSQGEQVSEDQVQDRPGPSSSCRHYFVHDGKTFLQPGRAPYWDPLQRTLTAMLGVARDPPFITSGPDGRGEDLLIKSAEKFKKCMTEVVENLSHLTEFAWLSHVTTVPAGTFAALERLTALRLLYVCLSGYRGNVHDRKSLQDFFGGTY